jgi:Domain of unknown function (DUF4383)
MSSATQPARPTETHALYETPIQRAAAATALLFGLAGLLGFLPAVTTDLGALEFAGHNSRALLLGLFAVSVVHNVVHLLTSIFGFALALTTSGARGFLIGGGVTYLVLCFYGLIIDVDSGANVLGFNAADNWLNLGLGAGMIALGLLSGRSRSAALTHARF